MKAYIAHSYSDIHHQSAVIEAIISGLQQKGFEAIVFSRKYASFNISQEKDMMSLAFREIENASLLVAEMSIKRVGVGVEVGYAVARGIPVIYIYKAGSNHSTTVGGAAAKTLVYKDIVDLKHKLYASLSGTI